MTEVRIAEDLWSDDLEGAVSVWLVEDGDRVEAGAFLCEVMVEKTTYEIAAPVAGTVTRLVEAEVPLARGDAVARID